MSAYEQHTVQLAIPHYYLIGLGPLIIGICIVALLIAAVWFGRRRSAGEPPVPRDKGARAGAWQTPYELPTDGDRPSDHGPGHQEGVQTHESRQPVPDEVPRDGRRRFPHELSPYGVRQGRIRTTPRRHSGPNID